MNTIKALFAAVVGVFRHTLTGRDNKTHDIARHSWAVSIVSVIAVAFWNAVHGVSVSLTELASALGIVSGAGAVAVKAKETAEPPPDQPAP